MTLPNSWLSPIVNAIGTALAFVPRASIAAKQIMLDAIVIHFLFIFALFLSFLLCFKVHRLLINRCRLRGKPIQFAKPALLTRETDVDTQDLALYVPNQEDLVMDESHPCNYSKMNHLQCDIFFSRFALFRAKPLEWKPFRRAMWFKTENQQLTPCIATSYD